MADFDYYYHNDLIYSFKNNISKIQMILISTKFLNLFDIKKAFYTSSAEKFSGIKIDTCYSLIWPWNVVTSIMNKNYSYKSKPKFQKFLSWAWELNDKEAQGFDRALWDKVPSWDSFWYNLFNWGCISRTTQNLDNLMVELCTRLGLGLGVPITKTLR